VRPVRRARRLRAAHCTVLDEYAGHQSCASK
jgi:hypothetical protein